MPTKTAELTGAELDYWVAKAQGLDCRLESRPTNPPKKAACWLVIDGKVSFASQYQPTMNWTEGGPIIEREGIELTRREVMPSLFEWVGSTMLGFEQMGATPLVAAMRAYVASKFGDTVPEEQA